MMRSPHCREAVLGLSLSYLRAENHAGDSHYRSLLPSLLRGESAASETSPDNTSFNSTINRFSISLDLTGFGSASEVAPRQRHTRGFTLFADLVTNKLQLPEQHRLFFEQCCMPVEQRLQGVHPFH
eukprot:NODE_4589_length_789_cov_23.604054_g4247_i0.p1 GENE.NODE_4589_length_789_cov_23.604054_g4247_i0~~NODE_4589_length_789_cov_23.604054_g4247_i0.p1  ORF type:complete len:126 (+),score=6.13 NODE_4589_length_789_cov_23.604054_g4247_i0:243-620(+)